MHCSIYIAPTHTHTQREHQAHPFAIGAAAAKVYVMKPLVSLTHRDARAVDASLSRTNFHSIHCRVATGCICCARHFCVALVVSSNTHTHTVTQRDTETHTHTNKHTFTTLTLVQCAATATAAEGSTAWAASHSPLLLLLLLPMAYANCTPTGRLEATLAPTYLPVFGLNPLVTCPLPRAFLPLENKALNR